MLTKKVMLVVVLVMAFLMVSCTQAPVGELSKTIGDNEIVNEEVSLEETPQEEPEVSSRMVLAFPWKIFWDTGTHYVHPFHYGH